MENKMTKADYFNEIRMIVDDTVEDVELKNELLEFVDKQLAAIDKRREAQAARAAKKREEADALTDRIYEILTNEFMTLGDIAAELGDEEISRNKITARLTRLVAAGIVEKENVKTDAGKRMAYRKIGGAE